MSRSTREKRAVELLCKDWPVVVVMRPGADRDHVLSQLREFGLQVGNLHTGGSRLAADRLFGYLEWAGSAARALSHVISSVDVDRLVLTRRYELLIGAAPGLVSIAGGNGPEGFSTTW